MPMNPEVKKAWVAALRSGEYKQSAARCLKSSAGWCCLGVLADLHAKENGGEWKRLKDDEYAYLGAYLYPAPEVREWADFHEDKQKVSIGGDTESVAVHNDGIDCPRRSFAEIADAIEAQL